MGFRENENAIICFNLMDASFIKTSLYVGVNNSQMIFLEHKILLEFECWFELTNQLCTWSI